MSMKWDKHAPCPEVSAIGKMDFGPFYKAHKAWFKAIRTEDDKPYPEATVILMYLVSMHKPIETRGGKHGESEQQFQGNIFRCSYADIEETFGYSAEQTRRIMKRLEDLNAIERHMANGRMCIRIIPTGIRKLSKYEIKQPSFRRRTNGRGAAVNIDKRCPQIQGEVSTNLRTPVHKFKDTPKNKDIEFIESVESGVIPPNPPVRNIEDSASDNTLVVNQNFDVSIGEATIDQTERQPEQKAKNPDEEVGNGGYGVDPNLVTTSTVSSPTRSSKRKRVETELAPGSIEFADWFGTLLPAAITITDGMRQSWAKTYSDLIRIDGRDPTEIRALCEWARADEFWRKNFNTARKLRERSKTQGITYYEMFKIKHQEEQDARQLTAQLTFTAGRPATGQPATHQPVYRAGERNFDLDRIAREDAECQRMVEERRKSREAPARDNGQTLTIHADTRRT